MSNYTEHLDFLFIQVTHYQAFPCMESKLLVFQHLQKQVYVSKQNGFVLLGGCSNIDDIKEALFHYTVKAGATTIYFSDFPRLWQRSLSDCQGSWALH